MFRLKIHTKRLALFLSGTLFTTSLLQAELIISESLEENTEDGIKDEDGFLADWIEIHNPDTSPVNLEGYSLTDDADLPTKWTFPSVNLDAGGFLRVYACGNDRNTNPLRLHTNFSLGINGEYLARVKPDGTTIADEFSPEDLPQIEGISYGLGNGGPVTQATFLPACSDACSSCRVSQLQRPFKIGASFSSVSVGHAPRGVKMAASSD